MSDVNGVQQVIANLSKIEKSIVAEVVSGAQAVQAKTINDARTACPSGVTGALAQSIQAGDIYVLGDDVSTLGVVAYVNANADYASYVEFPTKPHFPPVDALKDWARKFLGDEKLAFVVARAISRRGTYAQPFMGPALLANMSVFKTAIDAAVQRGIQAAGS